MNILSYIILHKMSSLYFWNIILCYIIIMLYIEMLLFFLYAIKFVLTYGTKKHIINE